MLYYTLYLVVVIVVNKFKRFKGFFFINLQRIHQECLQHDLLGLIIYF